MPNLSKLALTALIPAMGGAVPGLAADFRVLRDVSYLEAGRKEKLDLYLPARRPADPPSPAAVWIHGGGWFEGTKAESRAENVCSTLAAAGFVCANIDYRLGDNAWPANLFDCKNAVRFLRANAARFHLDPVRVAVLGGSAGGHLALMVGFTAGDPSLEPAAPYPGVSDSVAAVVDFYGPIYPLALGGTAAQKASFAGAFGLSADADPASARQYSPLAYITSSAPPVLIAHGLIDDGVPCAQSIDLAKALAEKGAGCELITLKNVGHSFDLVAWNGKPLPRDLRPDVLNFLRLSLGLAASAAVSTGAP